MKTLLFSTLFSLVSASAFARHGGIDSGGGNGTKSTPAEVSARMDETVRGREIGYDLLTALRTIHNGLSDTPVIPIRDSRAAPILRQLIQSDLLMWEQVPPQFSPDQRSGVKPWLNRLVFEKKLDSACIDQGRERDGSAYVEKTKTGDVAHICMSVPRLTRYPAKELPSQIAALFVHELTHLLGHGESDAVYIQNYVLHLLSEDCNIEIGEDNAPDGKSIGFIFHLSIKPDLTMDVKYYRYFKSPLNPYGNDSTATITSLRAEDYHFELTPGQAGKLSFMAMSYDGSYSKETVEWTDTKVLEDMFEKPIQALGLTGKLEVDGKSLPLTGAFFRSCLR